MLYFRDSYIFSIEYIKGKEDPIVKGLCKRCNLRLTAASLEPIEHTMNTHNCDPMMNPILEWFKTDGSNTI